MDSISLPVVHPAFERLKRSGVGLHILAALLILTHALSHFRHEESPTVYFWCQLLISLDILLLVLAGRDVLRQLPKVNLFFRVVEIVFFLGIGILMLMQGNGWTGVIHLLLSVAYSYLLYCEKGVRSDERLSFHHTGVTVPSLPDNHFLLWTDINRVEARYDSIQISTAGEKELHFDLRHNLEFAELEQIHEFCRHYIGQCPV
jgi:hypothetical protein